MPLRKLGSTNPACARAPGGCTSAPSKKTIGRQIHARAGRGSIADSMRLEVFTVFLERWLLQLDRLILVVPVVIHRITTSLSATVRGISVSNCASRECVVFAVENQEPDLPPFLSGFTSFYHN